MRRIVIIAEGSFDWSSAKTATGVIRYGTDTTVAVIDSTRAGQDVAHALHSPVGEGIPIVKDIYEALAFQPDTLLFGLAPRGGTFDEKWRWQVLAAIEHGLGVISGLHVFLAEDEELRRAAEKHNTTIWDVRRPPERRQIATFEPHRPGSRTVLMIGSDCGAGKMTAALELDKAARERGQSSTFLATGQTGIMIANNGLPVDRLIIDFSVGMVEEMVLEAARNYDWVFVEGQGAINHPAYSPVTLSLIHGSMPDAMIFCHEAGATTIEGFPQCPLPTLKRLIEMNEEALSWLRPTRTGHVVGLTLNTSKLNDTEARAAIAEAENATGLPATDIVRYGAAPLMDALERYPFNA